eukprot:12394560-Karenia_brevis.AAC.1
MLMMTTMTTMTIMMMMMTIMMMMVPMMNSENEKAVPTDAPTDAQPMPGHLHFRCRGSDGSFGYPFITNFLTQAGEAMNR